MLCSAAHPKHCSFRGSRDVCEHRKSNEAAVTARSDGWLDFGPHDLENRAACFHRATLPTEERRSAA
jgi:hypothetical protein